MIERAGNIDANKSEGWSWDTGRGVHRLEVVRYHELQPCFDAFIDTRSPGSDKKENFTIIGPGVAENAKQHVHIQRAHGFNIGGARQPPGCVNSQHSHDTAEVFYVHSGRWAFTAGEEGGDARVELQPGDLISIPTQAFRGFENIGEDIGFLWAVLGGDEPGRVLWAPRVFEMAQDFGLALLDDGSLIDLAAGEVIPSGKALLPPTTLEQMAKLTKLGDEDLESHCVRAPADAEIKDSQPPSIETLVGPGSGHNWYHGFTVERVTIPTGQALSAERFDGSEVWFVADGKALIIANSEEAEVGPGDTATVPSQSLRSLKCIGEKPAVLVRVRGLS